MPPRRISVAVHLFVLAALALAQDATTRPASPFSPDAYLAHVKYLASDELAGRKPGTAGIEKAAEYIARQFADAGLKPGGENGTYFQTFDITHGKVLNDAEAALKVEGVAGDWQVRRDWVPLPFCPTGDVSGPLAFAGYGIKAALHGYDDYAEFDAKGKVLLIFRYEPRSEDPEAGFGGREVSVYSRFDRKVETAARQEAKAVLIVNPPHREGLADDPLYPWDEDLALQSYELPIVHVKRSVAEALLRAAGLPDLATLQEQLEKERKPLSRDLGRTIELRTGVRPNRIVTRNVLGLLPGAGGTAETIVVGAHYDHIGQMVPQFDHPEPNAAPEIHNGADDNASGTAGVIEMARRLAREGGLRRNVLFIAFSGEEMGLLGSAHYVEHPTVELASIKAMINFDMIGRFGTEKFTVFGVPSATEFEPLLKAAADPLGLECFTPNEIAGNSDHFSFHQKQIPVLFAFTGVHKDYHRPSDDWERIDPDGATRILAVFHTLIRALADLEQGPTFQAETAAANPDEVKMKPAVEHARERAEEGGDGATDAKAEEQRAGRPHDRHGEGEGPRGKRPGVKLGILPDYAGRSDQPGVLVQSVTDGGPAKAAGMEAGDRIVRIGEQTIRDIYGYMNALRELNAGQTVEVVVVRKEQGEVTLKIKLAESGPRSEKN